MSTQATELPSPAPTVTPDSVAFWDATSEGRLVLPRCRSCNEFIWYPRFFCPRCSSTDLEWCQVSGRGTIYSFTITRRGMGDYKDAGPYVLAYVQLDVGPRMLTNVVDCDEANLEIGLPVEVVFHDTGGSASLPRFRPLAGD